MIWRVTKRDFNTSKAKYSIRIYYREKGANGKIVLDDIVKILMAEANKDEAVIAEVLEEKIKLAEVQPLMVEGLHLVGQEIYSFFGYCDDIAPSEIHFDLGNMLLKIIYGINKELIHLGAAVYELAAIEEATERIEALLDQKGEDREQLRTLKEWLQVVYGLSVPWTLTILSDKFKRAIADTTRTYSGEKIPQAEVPSLSHPSVNPSYSPPRGGNLYARQSFAAIITQVDALLFGNRWTWLRDSVSNNKNIASSVTQDTHRVKHLLADKKNSDEIIEIIWKVTPFSSMVDGKNPQYEILKKFLSYIIGR